MEITALLALSALTLTTAQSLDKPALTSNLDYLLDGNAAALPTVPNTISQWQAGSIPKDCKDLGEGEGLAPGDFEVYEVLYDDCADPWLFCRHIDVEVDIATAARTFSQLPVGIRDWVRQILLLPGSNSAFAINGNVAFIGTTGTNVDVMIHEAGHGLDGFAAFGESFGSSEGFLAAYESDTHVPDDYAQSSQAENVAQNTVVAVYDVNVPGGFPGVQEQYTAIENQYRYIRDAAGDAFRPGGTCERHLENSEIVQIGGVKSGSDSTIARRGAVARRGVTPESAFKGVYKNVVRSFEPFSFKEKF